MSGVVFIFWLMSAKTGILPFPYSPAFPDKPSCEEALNKADPFIPGKTACWPAPWQNDAFKTMQMPEAHELQSGPQHEERLD